ncbi:hypothetical protein D3C77_601720 [compost metagenome]
MPLTVALPWLAALEIVTAVTGPPLNARAMLLAELFATTVALTAPATGTWLVTTRVYACDPVKPVLSVACTAKLKLPAVVGVPLRVPPLDSARPPGKAPLARL